MSAVTRVQRVAAVWPTLHLEDSLPIWDSLVVDGLVHHPRRFDLAALQALGGEERSIPLHCVWGWSRPDATWVGIDLGRVLAIVEPEGGWVTVDGVVVEEPQFRVLDQTIALAKEQEEALLFRGMRGDIVQQLLRRLATLTPS